MSNGPTAPQPLERQLLRAAEDAGTTATGVEVPPAHGVNGSGAGGSSSRRLWLRFSWSPGRYWWRGPETMVLGGRARAGAPVRRRTRRRRRPFLRLFRRMLCRLRPPPGDASTTAPLLPEGAPSTPYIGELVASVTNTRQRRLLPLRRRAPDLGVRASGLTWRIRRAASYARRHRTSAIRIPRLRAVRPQLTARQHPALHVGGRCACAATMAAFSSRLERPGCATEADRLVSYFRTLDGSLPETEWAAQRIRPTSRRGSRSAYKRLSPTRPRQGGAGAARSVHPRAGVPGTSCGAVRRPRTNGGRPNPRPRLLRDDTGRSANT